MSVRASVWRYTNKLFEPNEGTIIALGVSGHQAAAYEDDGFGLEGQAAGLVLTSHRNELLRNLLYRDVRVVYGERFESLVHFSKHRAKV